MKITFTIMQNNNNNYKFYWPFEWGHSLDTDRAGDTAGSQIQLLLHPPLPHPSTPAGNAPETQTLRGDSRVCVTMMKMRRDGCGSVLTISTSPSATARSSFSTCQSHGHTRSQQYQNYIKEVNTRFYSVIQQYYTITVITTTSLFLPVSYWKHHSYFFSYDYVN